MIPFVGPFPFNGVVSFFPGGPDDVLFEFAGLPWPLFVFISAGLVVAFLICWLSPSDVFGIVLILPVFTASTYLSPSVFKLRLSAEVEFLVPLSVLLFVLVEP